MKTSTKSESTGEAKKTEVDVKLIQIAKAFRLLPGTATASGIAVLSLWGLSSLGPSIELNLLLSITLAVAMATFILFLAFRRLSEKARVGPKFLRGTPESGQAAELAVADLVLDLLRQGVVRNVVREPRINGLRAEHQVDMILETSSESYIVEVKTRPIVPSDIENATYILEDVKRENPKFGRLVLITTRKAPRGVSNLARSRNVEVISFLDLRSLQQQFVDTLRQSAALGLGRHPDFTPSTQ